MNPDTHLSYNKITSTATYSYTHSPVQSNVTALTSKVDGYLIYILIFQL